MVDSSRVGLVFSSGFFGFFAHAGFLGAVRELGIEPCVYGGASSGAIVAAMAASGMRDHEIKTMLFHVKRRDFWHPDPLHILIRSALSLFKGYSGYLNLKGFRRLLSRLPVSRIEECEKPLVIAATNLTDRKEAVFTRGNIVECIVASGAVPVLFKPLSNGSTLYVDGGVVDKAPLRAVSDFVPVDRIIVHFIASGNLSEAENGFLKRKMTPWHIQSLAVSIARQEAYRNQLEMMRLKGIEVIEVETKTPAMGPRRLHKGPEVYEIAKAEALKQLRAHL